MTSIDLDDIGDGPIWVDCPVCGARRSKHLARIEHRDYWRCENCEARFLDPRQWPSRRDEYAHYLHHENDLDDPRYRRFLSKLADPLLDRLAPGLHGLDFGCGPGPALAAMMREAGHRIALYDPFFHPDTASLRQTYDFIVCTETAEHFHRPAREFERFDRLLRRGGWLGILTCFQNDDAGFVDWHYRRDPTHVVFYREFTMRTIAAQFGWTCEIPVKDVALMRKPAMRPATEGGGS